MDHISLDETGDGGGDGCVVSLAAPHTFHTSGVPDEIAVAAVNSKSEAGLIVLRREVEIRAWQVEMPWKEPGTRERQLALLSRAQFLRSSVVHVVLGQTSALGVCEIGLYDVSIAPLRPLAAFRRHTELVSDV